MNFPIKFSKHKFLHELPYATLFVDKERIAFIILGDFHFTIILFCLLHNSLYDNQSITSYYQKGGDGNNNCWTVPAYSTSLYPKNITRQLLQTKVTSCFYLPLPSLCILAMMFHCLHSNNRWHFYKAFKLE